MHVMHYVAAVVALIATVLYADRTWWLANHGTTQTGFSLLTRSSWALLPLFLGIGFLQRAAAADPFLWFHWSILGALIGVCIGHIGMRGTAPT